ncbi:MAG: CoA transferase [Syntrophobacteraceae bacterium]|nr:CoA transferase [Syntrophobacteraceae bacterium]
MDHFRNLTVLSLEQALVLPYLTFRLAQDGMQVIRLEHPHAGDPNRLVGDNVLGEERMNAYYLCVNAGKKALTLNLAVPEGQKMLHRLIVDLKVDIFATNQLPKNYPKLGIDYESLKAVKPDIIWLGVTGFGPDSNEAAYDPILQARSGLMALTGERNGDPQVLGVPIPDMGSSEHAYGLVMKALYRRERSGEGACLTLSMFESCASWLAVPLTLFASFGRETTRRGNTHEFFCPVSVYRTLDGYVYLAVGNDRQWKSIVSLEPFALLDKIEYERNAGRINDVEALNRAIESVTRQLSSEHLLELFRSISVPISRIATVPEVAADPLVERRLLISRDPLTGTTLSLAPPPAMTPFLEDQNRALSFPPRFGEHNREIYGKALGHSEDYIKQLEQAGVI